MTVVVQTLVATAIASLAGLAGGLLLLARPHAAKRLARTLISFAAGALIGSAFLDLLPEALEAWEAERALMVALVGFFAFFVIEKTLLWYHCHEPGACHVHGDSAGGAATTPVVQATAVPLLAMSDAVHNFLDGVAIAAAFLVGPAVGVSASLAVLLHEIPQEVGDFSVFIAHGLSRTRAIAVNVASALAALAGAALALFAARAIGALAAPLAAFTAGGFLYIAAADLIPEIHRELDRSRIVLHVFLFLLGVVTIGVVGTLGGA